MAGLVEPVRVSPFIKFCRWGMLISGIFYGATRFQSLSKKQTSIRDEYEKTRVEREWKQKLLKEKDVEAELKMLADVTGSKFN